MAVLTRSCAKADVALIEQFEAQLLPSFTVVLSEMIPELSCYVFQILAMFIELREKPPHAGYIFIFPTLLKKPLWENKVSWFKYII